MSKNQLTLVNTSGPSCARCNDTGAIGDQWCDCPIAVKRRDKLQRQHDAAHRIATELHTDTVTRTDRIIAQLPTLADAGVAERVRRVLAAIALCERALEAFGQVGRRRSRKERAADALGTELVQQWRAIRATFDALDEDMYCVLTRDQKDVQGQLLTIVTTATA